MTNCLVLHNIRSAHNVGSLLRTANGLGVDWVYITGYTPYPKITGDTRLPHEIKSVEKRIHKTALGAERYVNIVRTVDLEEAITHLRKTSVIFGLEQSKDSLPINNLQIQRPWALILGNEVDGLSQAELSMCDQIIEIPMKGKKESFNVAAAGAMALFYMTNLNS